MSKEQARALLALIAELYMICNTPDPDPDEVGVADMNDLPADLQVPFRG